MEFFKTYIPVNFKERKSGSSKKAISSYFEMSDNASEISGLPSIGLNDIENVSSIGPDVGGSQNGITNPLPQIAIQQDDVNKVPGPNTMLDRELDLFYGLSILVSEGVNRNSDAFLRNVLISAFKSPRHKFVDWEHDVHGEDKKANPERYQVIGHIYDSTLATQDGSYIPEWDVFKDSDGQWFSEDSNWRGKALDIIVAWVIYKFEFPEIVEKILTLAVTHPDTFGVSMEVLFSDYKFRIGAPVHATEEYDFDGNSTGAREVHKGDPLADMFNKGWNDGKFRTWNGLPVVRILGGTVFFSGMAITENRANKRSWNISFAKNQVMEFKDKGLAELVKAIAKRGNFDIATCNIVNGQPDCECLEKSFSSEMDNLNKTLGELMETVAKVKKEKRDTSNKKQIMGRKVADTKDNVTIYLSRHGETDLNSEDCLRGWKNPPLNNSGREEVAATADMFKEIDLNKAYVSNLDRTQETGNTILKGKKVKREDTILLRPINFGDWNGQKLSDIGEDMNKLQKAWEKDPDKSAPKGESFNDFQGRQIEIFEKIFKDAKAGDKILVVGSLRNCIWLLAYLMNRRKPLEGQDLEKLNAITQGTSNVSVINYNPKTDQAQITAVNVDRLDNQIEDEKKQKLKEQDKKTHSIK